MTEQPEQTIRVQYDEIARQADYLAGEVKLLAINLALTLARVQNHDPRIRQLEPQFAELIKRANDTAGQVDDVIKAFRNQKLMICHIPASSEVIALRGAFDKTEATLDYVYALSQKMIELLTQLKVQKKEGTSAESR